MTRRSSRLLVAVALLASSACYRGTVDTGLTPSPQTVDRRWAAGWLFGLVPPQPTETIQHCGAPGVARVEMSQSFLNQFVSTIALGIYTPMEIKVTCAAAPVR